MTVMPEALSHVNSYCSGMISKPSPQPIIPSQPAGQRIAPPTRSKPDEEVLGWSRTDRRHGRELMPNAAPVHRLPDVHYVYPTNEMFTQATSAALYWFPRVSRCYLNAQARGKYAVLPRRPGKKRMLSALIMSVTQPLLRWEHA